MRDEDEVFPDEYAPNAEQTALPEDVLDEDHDEPTELSPDEQSDDLRDPEFAPHRTHAHYCMACNATWLHAGDDCLDMNPKTMACPTHEL